VPRVSRSRVRPSLAVERGLPDRFRTTDAYRAQREWNRYEGTAYRDLLRVLRERFLERHGRVAGSWALDLGSGPGRFSSRLSAGGRVVVADISRAMLAEARKRLGAPDLAGLPYRFVQLDARRIPLRAGSFDAVAVLGHTIGFSGCDAPVVLDSAMRTVRPGGHLLLEFAAGAGERSRWAHALPATAFARALRAPPAVALGRAERAGFEALEPRREPEPGSFRAFAPAEILSVLRAGGFSIVAIQAVAPLTGAEPDRLAPVRADEKSWRHLLDVEEALGIRPERQRFAASILLSAIRTGSSSPNWVNRPTGEGQGGSVPPNVIAHARGARPGGRDRPP
jgi:SAM-dependent methyltransferase